MSSACWRLSIWHGPANSAIGRSLPKVTSPTTTARLGLTASLMPRAIARAACDRSRVEAAIAAASVGRRCQRLALFRGVDRNHLGSGRARLGIVCGRGGDHPRLARLIDGVGLALNHQGQLALDQGPLFGPRMGVFADLR